MLGQSLQLVTSSHLALIHQTLDNLFIYEEKTSHKQEEAFWRWKSQGVNYPLSYTQLPSLRKGPSGKVQVGSVQKGRRVRNPQQWPEPIPHVRPQPKSGLLPCVLLSSVDPPVLGGMSLQDTCPAHPSEAAVEEWKRAQIRSQGLTLHLTKCMTSNNSLSLPGLSFFIHKISLPILLCCQKSE